MTAAYGDWQGPLADYFGDQLATMRVVELGKGEGTRWLHARCKRVVSLEYSRYPFTASWEAEGLPDHVCVHLPTPRNLADLDGVLVRSRGKERPAALADEARKIHDAALPYGGDLLFIDHGCHNRGEVLECAFQAGWPYIAIHDTNFPYYGYRREHPCYDATEYSAGQGTIIFKRKAPIVTFVIPSIGRNTVEHTVLSLRRLTYPLWHAIVGFDALTDEQVSTLRFPDDDRITTVNLPEKAGGGRNFGGGTRNQLFGRISTPWLAFVDDDDSVRPDYLDRLNEARAAHPTARCVVFRMSYDPQDTKVLPPLGTVVPVKNKVGISFAVAKSLLDDLGLRFVNGPTEDFDLLNRIHAAGEPIVFSPHIVYNVRF